MYSLDIITKLPRVLNKKKINYEFICGIDYRFLTPELAIALKPRVKKIRLAWDWGYKDQLKILEKDVENTIN